LYNKMLGRLPDDAGKKFFVSFIQQGGTLEQVAGQLAGSNEYASHHGLNSAYSGRNFINEIYHDAFGRDVDTAGQNFWSAAMSGHYASYYAPYYGYNLSYYVPGLTHT